MHRYRSHTCGELRASDVGTDVRLSGWLHNRRDLGGILFIDLRDHYGITQLVARPGTPAYEALDKLSKESTVRVDGKVVSRGTENVNPDLPTGEVEVEVGEVELGHHRVQRAGHVGAGIAIRHRVHVEAVDAVGVHLHRVAERDHRAAQRLWAEPFQCGHGRHTRGMPGVAMRTAAGSIYKLV